MKQLVIHLDRNSVKFQRVVENEVTEEFCFSFTEKTDFGYKQQLDFFLEKTDFKSQEWDDYSLAWFGEKSTLLPYSIFAGTDTTKIFQLSFGAKTEESDIDFNRIPEHTLVNLFEIPIWVKSFFVVRFPRIVMQHLGTHAIRGAFNGNTYGLKIYILPFSNHFLMLAVKENELAFYNYFEFQNSQDLFYHIAHVIQQKNWTAEKGILVISETLSDLKLHEELEKNWKNISLLSNITLQNQVNLMTQFQQFCV